MNYIILNGKKSTLINGLLISSLPPISKPLIRTQVEEIDGRDGDQVTKLGYAAYDKELEIGLRDNYNVNDVIAYFDSEGIVTFSNEPDKFYKYQIIDQIDFEKLIRYKTATVTFHVQPFKYSAVENTLEKKIQLVNMRNFSGVKNGVTLTGNGDRITINGTASAATEFYVPVDALSLKVAEYTLSATASGTNASSCAIRLIRDVPSDANTFGGRYAYLQNGTITVQDDLYETKTFNYLWFYILPNNAINITISVSLQNDEKSISITNTGNTISKPIITLFGNGSITLSVNNVQLFIIDIPNGDGQISIDSALMEAYFESPLNLRNRIVTGNYDNLSFKVGKNIISWSGNISKIAITNYSRWI